MSDGIGLVLKVSSVPVVHLGAQWLASRRAQPSAAQVWVRCGDFQMRSKRVLRCCVAKIKL